MEQIGKMVVQAQTNLPQLLQGDLSDSKKEISLYGEGQVSPEALAGCFVDLKKAFPKLSDGWYDLLEKFLDAEKFTDRRLMDATQNLIKNCVYPEPTIANILGFDKLSKLWTYEEALAFSNDFSTERRRIFWDGLEIHDKEKKLWREKR